MSLKPHAIQPVPEATVRVARAAFPKGNLYLRMRDELGTLFQDEAFAALFPTHGQPAAAPWRLALVTLMQFVEDLTDRAAAEAVRARIDWKYALGLELDDAGFDFSVLCEFRSRLLAGQQEQLLFEAVLARFKELGLLKAGGRQRSDSTHVVANLRTLNRLECIGETLRAALNRLAVLAPEWVSTLVDAAWFERYALPFMNERLPKAADERTALAAQIGQDGFHLLAGIEAEEAPAWLRDVPAVQVLRWVWLQQFYAPGEAGVQWRDPADLPPCAQRIHSPYEIDARYSSKRTTVWTGYKVHLTESCDEEGPYLITDVQTTPGTTADRAVTTPIHQHLAERALLPQEHLVDAGYLDADLLVEATADFGISLLGPVAKDGSWQKSSGQGYDIAHFVIDWEAEQVTCPNGKLNREWKPTTSGWGLPVIHIEFDKRDCLACPARQLCTRAKAGAREITVRPQAQHLALQQARQRQRTDEFKLRYNKRAGIEGTHSQGVHAFGLRKARYKSASKTALQHLATAAAINLVRYDAWCNEIPHAQTRISRFAALAPHAA